MYPGTYHVCTQVHTFISMVGVIVTTAVAILRGSSSKVASNRGM